MEQIMQSDIFQSISQFVRGLNFNKLSTTLDNLPTDQIPGTDQITQEATEILHKITTGAFAVGLILALLGCFFGYKMLKFWISLAGLFIGAAAGYGITWYMTNNATYALIGTIAGAILLSILSYKIYLVGVFLLFGFGAYFLSLSYLPLDGLILTIAAVAIGLVVAILAVIYMRPAIIVITGLQNGLLAVGALAHLVSFPNQSLMIPVGVGLGMLGAAFQFMTTRTKREKRKRADS